MTLTRAKNDDAQVRERRAAVVAEARLHPLRAGQDVRAPQPRAHEHHQEDLVERRPDPRQPDALEAVEEEHIDQPHRAADVEHARGVRDAEQYQGSSFAAEKVGVEVLDPAPGNPQAEPRMTVRK
jgi:hypothetical protein